MLINIFYATANDYTAKFTVITENVVSDSVAVTLKAVGVNWFPVTHVLTNLMIDLEKNMFPGMSRNIDIMNATILAFVRILYRLTASQAI